MYHWFFAGIFLSLSLSATPRTWTAADGRQMQAEFVRIDRGGIEDEVVFRMPNGNLARVAISSLSEADQKFAREAMLAQREEAAAVSAPANPPQESVELTEFEKILANSIRYNHSGLMRSQPASEFAPRQYYALYFSAEWCPPCRRFTPNLVEFYNEMREKEADIEVILVSSDRDDRSMRNYISEYKMTFPAVEYRRIRNVKDRVETWGTGIPNLVVVDREGKAMFQAYEKESGKYLGPNSVLNRLRPLLAKN